MKIKNGIVSKASPVAGLGQGSEMVPKYIVIHYTAGSTLKGAVSALKSAGNSYNILIDKDGSIHQARRLDRTSSHAGRSNWKANGDLTNSSSLNANGIGISLVNVGLHDFFLQGRWWYGYDKKTHNGKPPSVRDEDANKKSSIYVPKRQQHWDPYTKEQIESCRKLVSAILKEYGSIEEIVGHDDIAIDDKFDPGPDFPLQEFRDEFKKVGGLGLEAKVASPDGQLTLLDRPQHMGGQEIGKLKKGDVVHIRSVTYASAKSAAVLIPPSKGRALTGWASIDVSGSNLHSGFVSLRYLTRNPLAKEYAQRL